MFLSHLFYVCTFISFQFDFHYLRLRILGILNALEYLKQKNTNISFLRKRLM